MRRHGLLMAWAMAMVPLIQSAAVGSDWMVTNPPFVSSTALVAASDAPDYYRRAARYVCDGTADEVEIQAAIDALQLTTNSKGGTVELSPGRFIFSAPLYIDRPQVGLIGQGCGLTTIYMATNSNCDCIRYRYTAASSGWWHVRGILFDGNIDSGHNPTGGHCLRADRSEATTTWDGTALTCDTDGSTGVLANVSDTTLFVAGTTVKMSAGMASTSTAYTVSSVDHDADTVTLATNSTSAQTGVTMRISPHCFDARIEDCFIYRFHGDGIRTSNTWGWSLRDVVIEYCDGDGMRVRADDVEASVNGPKLNGCKIINNRGHALHLGRYITNSIVMGNELSGGRGKYGVYLEGADANLIQGNHFLTTTSADDTLETNPSAAIYLGGYKPSGSMVTSDRNTIIGNNARDTASTSQTITAVGVGSTVTFTDAGDVVNWTGHPLVNGDIVQFSNTAGALPAGGDPAMATYTDYYVTKTGDDTFTVYTDVARTSQLTWSDTGSGTTKVGKCVMTGVAGAELGIVQVGSILWPAASVPLTGNGNLYVVSALDSAAGTMRVKLLTSEVSAAPNNSATITWQTVQKIVTLTSNVSDNVIEGNTLNCTDTALNGTVWDTSGKNYYGLNHGIRGIVGGKVAKTVAGAATTTLQWGGAANYSAGVGISLLSYASSYATALVLPGDADAAAEPFYVSAISTGAPGTTPTITLTANDGAFTAGDYVFHVIFMNQNSGYVVTAP